MRFEPLDAFAARVLERGWSTALAVAVTDANRVLVARSYGAAPDALWPVASIGKSFAAVIALQLDDEGRLDLHVPVTEYVPWLTLGRDQAPVTLHHLLTHSAGLVESLDLAPASNHDVIALTGMEAGFQAGEHRHYSNVGYRAAGVVLETVTGRPYGQLLQERVFDRVGLRNSEPVMTGDTRRRLPGGHAPFYDDRPWRREHGLAPAPWVDSAEADGCSCCGLEDLATYLRALWRGEELLHRSGLELMKTALPPHGEHDAAYGYGLDIHPDGFGHGGDMLGYVSHMRVDTDAGLGVVAFANGFAGAWAIGEGALALASGRELPELAPDDAEPLADDGSCPPGWRPYIGRYRCHNPWLPTFLVAAADEALVIGTDWLNGSERLTLAPLADDRFRVGEPDWSPERLSFDTVIGGRAQRAVYSGTPYYRAFAE